MKLHGIAAPFGTVIGIDYHSGRFVVPDNYDFGTPATTMNLRFATGDELSAIGTREPRSVTEHRGIPQRMTPYGPARIFGPRPFIKPKQVTKREAKRMVENYLAKYGSVIIDGQHGR